MLFFSLSFLFLFTKLDQMSRVGSRDRHAGWRSKKVSVTEPKLNREAKFVNVNYKECEKLIGVYFALVFCRLEVKS